MSMNRTQRRWLIYSLLVGVVTFALVYMVNTIYQTYLNSALNNPDIFGQVMLGDVDLVKPDTHASREVEWPECERVWLVMIKHDSPHDGSTKSLPEDVRIRYTMATDEDNVYERTFLLSEFQVANWCAPLQSKGVLIDQRIVESLAPGTLYHITVKIEYPHTQPMSVKFYLHWMRRIGY